MSVHVEDHGHAPLVNGVIGISNGLLLMEEQHRPILSHQAIKAIKILREIELMSLPALSRMAIWEFAQKIQRAVLHTQVKACCRACGLQSVIDI